MEQLELCYLSAQKAIELFRSKKLSPVDLMQAMITRAEEVEPHINAFSYTHFEDALKSARAAEDAYMRGTARPLEGIPFAVKDESDIEGWPMSNGSLLLKENVSEMTTITVERAMNAGAIVHARTTTPEFSAAVFTWSKLWGITRNPWNLAITPGGSTGGGAAALAAGTTTIINGTDIGGSIRVPASMCGVVGYKPPFGRNPEDPPWNIETYTHSGPLARNIGDTILLQNIMSGPHPNDIVSLKPKITLPDSYETIKGKRIGFSYDLGFQPLHPDIRNLLNQALDRFRAAGAIVEEVEVGWSMEMNQATLNHLSYGMVGISIAQAHAAGGDLLTSYALKMAEYSRAVTAEDYVAAAELAASMYRRLSSIFESYDLLVCPTVALPGVPADHDYSQDTLTIDGQPVDSKFGWVMTYPFNMLSRCPVLNVPIGRASNNVPIGMQLIGPTYEDAVVFQFGAAYEAQCQTEPQTNPFINPNNRPVIG